MPPSRMMTMEMTHARTGRSMKKRASTAGLLLGLRRLWGVSRRKRDRHLHETCLDCEARPYLLEADDDHALAWLQAFGDLTQAVMQRSQPNGAGDHLVVLVHDVHDLLPL